MIYEPSSRLFGKVAEIEEDDSGKLLSLTVKVGGKEKKILRDVISQISSEVVVKVKVSDKGEGANLEVAVKCG